MKKIILTALYSIFLVAFYQLIMTPLLLDLSSIGLLILLAGSVLAFYAIPRPMRRTVSVMTLLFLLMEFGVMNIYNDNLAWRFLEFPLMFLVLGWIGASFGKIKWRYTLTGIVTIAVLLQIIPLSNMPFYRNFHLAHKSEVLDRKPILPVSPIASQGNDLYTLGDLRKVTDAELKEADPKQNKIPLAAADKSKALLEYVDVLRFSPDDNYKKHSATKDQVSKLPFTSLGLAGFPYYTSSWIEDNGGIKQHFTYVDDPQTVLTSFFQPLTVNIAMDERASRSVQESRENWTYSFGVKAEPQYPGAALVGKGKFMAGDGNQLVLLGNNEIQLMDEQSPAQEPLAVYKGEMLWGESVAKNFAIGDVDGDGLDELMVNTVPAKVLKLNQNRTWDTIWESGKETFRFEFVQPRPGQKTLIIAQDPSLIRDKPDRFLTGYTWNNGQLDREWRVFRTNLVFPFPVSSDTWASGFAGEPHLFVMKQLPVPVPEILITIYALLVAGGFGYQVMKRRELRHG